MNNAKNVRVEKISNLIDGDLDYAVAFCLGYSIEGVNGFSRITYTNPKDLEWFFKENFNPSSSWALAGWILDAYKIDIRYSDCETMAKVWCNSTNDFIVEYGPVDSALVAAMRCFVRLKTNSKTIAIPF